MRCIVSLVIGGSLMMPAALSARQPEGGWFPALELRVVSAYPDGSRPGSFGRWKLAKDAAPFTATVWSGPSLCSIGIGGAGTQAVTLGNGPGIAPRTPQSANVWTMSGAYEGETAGRHAVKVTSRFERFAGQESGVSTTQTLSLREGDRVTLDALRGAVDAACAVHTVTLEAGLVMQAAATELARTQYTADLWLVRTTPGGEERREHLTTTLDGSGAVPFRFSRLAFNVTTAEPASERFDVSIQLSGTLRARPRPDGQIDVDIDTDPRMFAVEEKENPPSEPSGPPVVMRRKTLTLKLDETTAIDFPSPVGFRTATVGPERRSIRLFYDAFFKGQKTVLLIRLQRPR